MAAALVLAVATAAVSAQESADSTAVASPITDHFAFRAGYMLDRVDTFARFDSPTGTQGTPLSAEQDLGLADKTQQPRIELDFRIGERSRVRIDFLDLSRSADKLIDRSIDYGNQTFAVNSLVHSEIEWRQMDITYTYSFIRNERFELGAGLGVHAIDAQASGEVAATSQRADFSGAGPFATLALDGTWRVSKRWSLNARGQYLRVSVHDYTGMLDDYAADVQFRWRPNLALGVAYETQRAELDAIRHNPAGVVRLQLSGPQLFVRVSY